MKKKLNPEYKKAKAIFSKMSGNQIAAFILECEPNEVVVEYLKDYLKYEGVPRHVSRIMAMDRLQYLNRWSGPVFRALKICFRKAV